MGGLIAGLWADARRRQGIGVADAVILNSPWLDLQGSLLLRTLGTRAIDQIGARRPYQVIPRSVTEVYTDGLHSDRRGEWAYDLTLKPATGLPIRAGCCAPCDEVIAAAPRHRHRRAGAGAGLQRTSFIEEWSDDVAACDIVLDVEQIAGWSHRLGSHVTIARLDGPSTTYSCPARTSRGGVRHQQALAHLGAAMTHWAAWIWSRQQVGWTCSRALWRARRPT
jgi:hypothetical protein